MFNILIVDDDADLRLSVQSALSENHYKVDQAQNGEECLDLIRLNHYDLILLDINMPKITGIETLKEIKAYDASIIVIILTAFSNIQDAVESTKKGAYNYLEKPIKAENLVTIVDKALKAKHLVHHMSFSAPIFQLPTGTDFIGQSTEMKKIFSIIDKLSRVDTVVLIRGESGTGKELVAKALHYNSLRKDNRFVTVNCSAIPENLIESELFGHEKGAFTDAKTRKIGKFQYADGGTLFLDEIGDISLSMQVKLLRALQEKKFIPLGSNREVEVNLRIVAATNRNLESMIENHLFREDLFYRLNVLPIHLPALRDRKNDIKSLCNYFILKFNHLYQKNISQLSKEVFDFFQQYDWPGNIRELENVIEHTFVIENSKTITINSLPESLLKYFNKGKYLETCIHQQNLVDHNDLQSLDFQANKEAFEKEFLTSALRAYKGKINQTALHAKIPKKTLLRKLGKYGIKARDYSS